MKTPAKKTEFDDVLRRMLSTAPQPKTTAPKLAKKADKARKAAPSRGQKER